MRLHIAVVATAVAALAAAPSFAQEAPKEQNENSHAGLFDQLDSNQDGWLASDEAPEEHRRLFARLLGIADEDRDGKLSREEFIHGLAADEPPDQSERLEDRRAPGGGFRQRPEGPPDGRRDMRRGPGMGGMAIVRVLDANGDGTIDADEIASAAEALKKLDRNNDGKLSGDELAPAGFGGRGVGGPGFDRPGPRGVREGFRVENIVRRLMQGDANNDGKLQRDELPRGFERRWDEMDANDDDALDVSEIKAAFESMGRGEGPGREGGRRLRRSGPPERRERAEQPAGERRPEAAAAEKKSDSSDQD